jgi:hypothetical protein
MTSSLRNTVSAKAADTPVVPGKYCFLIFNLLNNIYSKCKFFSTTPTRTFSELKNSN